jgi:hypothetical protein
MKILWLAKEYHINKTNHIKQNTREYNKFI